jgi:hypothetical protein
MDFNEAEQQRTQLTARLNQGQISRESYTSAINALRVTDGQGRSWQPDPGGTGWLCWNGSAWQAAMPPAGTAPAHAKDFNAFRGSLMTVDEWKKISKEVPLKKRPQKWWDLLSILGGIAGAVIWVVYSGIREGIDILSPILMIAIPVCLVWFRADIDEMLLPLQPRRKQFPKLILIGCGIVLPFLTAFILFNIGIRNYPLMYINMVIGTFGAYALTRDPVEAPGRQSRPGTALPSAITILAGITLAAFLVPFVRADDCTRDVLNVQDCLRTDGFAEVIAGFVASLLSILVNGPAVIQNILQGSTGTTGTQPPVPPVTPQGPKVGDSLSYVDARGETHTAVLQPDGHWLSDKGTWYDPDYANLLAEGQKIDAANAAARAQNAAQLAKDADAFKQMTDGFKAQLDAAKNFKSPDTAAFQKWYRDFLTQDNLLKQAAADRANLTATLLDYGTKGAEFTEKAADMSIDVLSKMTGPQGKALKTAYTTIKDISKGVSGSFASGQDLADGLVKGIEDAAVDFAFDKAKEKFISSTGGKVPFFKDFKGGNFSGLSDKVISNALNKNGATQYFEGKIRDAARDAMNNMVQGRVQKFLVKDPLKQYLGLK